MTVDDVVGRRQGVLAEWNDDRGFGFITPATGGARVFVHVSSFPRGRRPVAGCEVTYAESRDERNRARAAEVRYLGGAVSARRTGASGVPSAVAAASLFFILLAGVFLLDELPVTVLAAYGLFSAVAFLMYGADKSAAKRQVAHVGGHPSHDRPRGWVARCAGRAKGLPAQDDQATIPHHLLVHRRRQLRGTCVVRARGAVVAALRRVHGHLSLAGQSGPFASGPVHRRTVS